MVAGKQLQINMNIKSNATTVLFKSCLALWILLLALAGRAVDAQAADRTFTLKISRDQKNPVRNGLVCPIGDAGKWTFQFELDPSLELVNPPQPIWTKSTTKANPNQGQQNWGLWVQAKNALPPAGPNPNNTWIAFSMPDEPGGTFTATVTAKARTKRGPGGVGGNGVAGPDDEFEFTATWTGEVSDITVEFETDLIKTGFTIPVPKVGDPNTNIVMPEIKAVVIATVTPAAETNNIVFVCDPTTQNRAEIIEPPNNRDAATGKITLWIKGTSATPTTQPNGDMKILAKKGTTTTGSAKVVVLHPRGFRKPVPGDLSTLQFKGAVLPINKGLGKETFPVDTSAPDGKVSLVTIYATELTITVLDQFGEKIDKVYVSQPITEAEGKNIQEINGQVVATYAAGEPIIGLLSGEGTYADPVGVAIPKKEAGKKVYVAAQGEPYDSWPNAPKLPMSQEAQDGKIEVIQTYRVKVGGHMIVNLDIPIENRTETTPTMFRGVTGYPEGDLADGPDKKPNTLKIEW